MSETEQPTRGGFLSCFSQHFNQEIDESWSDAVLIFSCMISGLIDSAVYNVFTCFVSMQTGNTVYVGLGIAGQPADSPYRWAKSLNAIICFCIGNLFFSRVGRAMNPLLRSTMVLSWLFQAALVFVSVGIIASDLIPTGAEGERKGFDPIVLLPLGLLSFGAAGQIVQSRVLQHTEVPTVVLTSTYCDLMLDPNLFTASLVEDPKRNRRFLSIVFLLAGAAVGGFLTQDGRVDNALWLAGAAKLACAIVWLVWKGKTSVRLE